MSRTWKSRVIRAAAKLLAVTVTATSCLSGMAFTARAEGYGKNGTMRDISSQQLVEDMGLGYNIGNTFDSIGSFIQETDPWEYQKAWGNEPVSQLFIQKVKEGGFKTIRLPVSWAHWIDANNQVNPAYMQAVQTVVDWCMDEDLYVILNIHHDSGAADTSWIRKAATDWEGTSAKYAAVWTQISENFKAYGDHLIFEGMNEVEFPDAPTMSRQYEILNSMNQLFVDSVRATGGNNAVRHLLIPGYNTDIKKTCDRRYQMPSDPANHCILSIHYYSPSPFCVAEHDVDWAVPVTTWGSEEDIQNVEADLNILAEHFLSKGTPVIIGEYGVLTEDNKEKDSIRDYLNKVPEIIMQYGMCPVLWDTSNAGDMKTIERVTGDFYDPVVKANYLALAQKKAAGLIQKKEFYFPTYQRVAIPITPGGWTSLESAFEPEKIVGIAFELDCATDWDSYGGGGIYLDGWDNMPQWGFNSVYDEVVYMFNAEEKARLHDQLAVLIFWTDENNGGSRREQLSIKGNQITLLYGENEQVYAPRLTTGISSGGGGGGSKGSSRYPNNSTDPVGDEANNDETKTYAFILKKDIASYQDEGRQIFDAEALKALCPEYEIGDKIRVSLSYLSNGGPSFALSTSEGEGYYRDSSDGGQMNGNTLTWECTPPDGKVTVNLWYLGKDKYFMYNLNVEVVNKADEPDDPDNPKPTFTITQDAPAEYSVKELLERNELAEGSPVKITILAAPESGVDADSNDIRYGGANVSIFDNQNNKITANFNWEYKAVLAGKFSSQMMKFTAGNDSYKITDIRIEQENNLDEIGELNDGGGRFEVGEDIITGMGISDDKPGVKIYFETNANLDPDDPDNYDLNNLQVNGKSFRDLTIAVENGENYVEYFADSGKVTGLVFTSYSPAIKWLRAEAIESKGNTDPEQPNPDDPELNDNELLVEAGEDGKYHIPEERGVPKAIRFKASGGTNEWGANLEINCEPWSLWIDFTAGIEKTYTFEEEYSFTEMKLVDKIVDYMIFVYPEDTTNPDEPDLKDGEILVEANEDGKYYIPEGRGVPKAIRFSASTNGKYGSSLAFIIGEDNWAAGSVGWVSFGDNEDTTYTFGENTEFEALSLTQDGIVVNYMYFIYEETKAASPMTTLANAMLYRLPFTPVEEEEIFEVEALADEHGVYYLPEDMEVPLVGICAEVSSNKKDVKIIFDEDSEMQVNVTPENKKAYYFVDKHAEINTIQFKGQKVNKVTFLYWNGEAGEAAEKDNVFNLPDYRVPAAVQFTVGGGEEENAEAVLLVELYDSETKQWKKEGKVLTENLSVKAGGTGWYVFTDKNQDVLKNAFAKAKDGYAAPRLRFAVKNTDNAVEEVIAYYNVSYTDEMEIVAPDEHDEKDSFIKENGKKQKDSNEAAESKKDTSKTKAETNDKMDEKTAADTEEGKPSAKPDETDKADETDETDKADVPDETGKEDNADKPDEADKADETNEADKAGDLDEADKADAADQDGEESLLKKENISAQPDDKQGNDSEGQPENKGKQEREETRE